MQESDEKGGLPGELEDVAPVAARGIFPAVVHRPEDAEATHDPCEDYGPKAEEFFLDDVVEQKAEDGGGEETDEDGDGELESLGIAAEDAHEHFQDVFVVKAEDGEDGPALDADGEGVSGDFVDFRKRAETHEALGDDKVPRRTDWEILGDAFDEAEEDGLPDFHKRWREFGGKEVGGKGKVTSGQ